ncbi:MAG: hypothetical protein KAX38_10035 [Candidatus Krumholzibacteria bacterium]|nr:hypothetical protein [Candidatus Krumholzibacteria bacterium]
MNFDERGYLADPYRVDFSARVREVEPAGGGRFGVYLDRTFFYPFSGGQPDDRGALGGKRVVEVTEDDNGVRHLVEGELKAGEEVEGHIDWNRRFDHMQQHSGQHLLSQVFLDMLKLQTVGFHLGDNICTIDLDGDLHSVEDIESVESSVNELIWQAVPIKDRVIGREEYEKLTLYGEGDAGKRVRSRLPETAERVRIVEIVGVDSSTCCGTHCRSTGEIGMIKITGTERVRGRARVEFVCGVRALTDYAGKHRLVNSLSLRFSTDWRELGKVVDKLSEENKSLRKANEELGRELAGFKARELAAPTGSVGEFDLVKRVVREMDAGTLRDMAFRIRDGGGKVILFGICGSRPGLIFARSSDVPLNMGELMRLCAPVMGARGGGGEDFAQGGGGDESLIKETLDEAERRIREALK